MPGLAIIVVVQLVYTVVTLALTYILLDWKSMNEAFLLILFLLACWNGSRFYFEAMVERALKAERKKEKEAEHNKEDTSKKEKKPVLVLYSSQRRFVTFVLFMVVALGGNKFLVENYIM